MYHAKQQGKAAFQYYSAAMNAASVERLTLESGLRRALEDGSLAVHYQPQVDVRTGRIVGAEALLRWKHPQRGYISPATFIPIAEDSGLILPIGEWVLEQACRQAVEWQRAGLPQIPIAINVSGVQFRRQDLASWSRDALRSTRPRSADAANRDHGNGDRLGARARRGAARVSCASSASASRSTTSAPATRR